MLICSLRFAWAYSTCWSRSCQSARRSLADCQGHGGPFNPLETPPLHSFLHLVFRCPSNGNSSGCSAYLWPSNGDCVTWLFRLSVERDAAHNRILCLDNRSPAYLGVFGSCCGPRVISLSIMHDRKRRPLGCSCLTVQSSSKRVRTTTERQSTLDIFLAEGQRVQRGGSRR